MNETHSLCKSILSGLRGWMGAFRELELHFTAYSLTAPRPTPSWNRKPQASLLKLPCINVLRKIMSSNSLAFFFIISMNLFPFVSHVDSWTILTILPIIVRNLLVFSSFSSVCLPSLSSRETLLLIGCMDGRIITMSLVMLYGAWMHTDNVLILAIRCMVGAS